MYKHITKEGKEFDGIALALSDDSVKVIFCDIETTGLDPLVDKILSFQIMIKDEIFIFDFLHLTKEHLKYLLNLINLTGVVTVFHNAKFDIKFLYNATGIWLKNVFDTMNCEVLINAGLGKSFYSLEDLALKYSGIKIEKETRAKFFTEEVVHFTEQMLIYSANDVKVLEDIYNKQVQIINEAGESRVLKLEMDLIPVVAKMEFDGVLLDVSRWSDLVSKNQKALQEAEKDLKRALIDSIDYSKYPNAFDAFKEIGIRDSERTNSKGKRLAFNKAEKEGLALINDPNDIRVAVDRFVNLGSHDQLRNILNLIGVPIPNTNEKTMVKYASKYEFISRILDFREASKSISTYGFNIIEQIHPNSGRIHTEFLNMGAATGRFSSTSPNLQNIPTSEGYRESFIAQEGYKWVSVDYSQQEYRLAGAISKEPLIINAYRNNYDMHTATAAHFFKKKFDEVTKDERKWGKTRNFEIIYGASEYGLSRSLKCSLEEAKEVLNEYWRGYPRLFAFKKAVEEEIMRLGYSITLLGRRRYSIEKPLYMNNFEYSKYESRVKREGFNHIIQGSGADIIKTAMVNIYNKNPFGDKLRMLIQVHDELNFEVHQDVVDDATEFIKTEMLDAEQHFLGEVPAAVDSKIGDYWIH